MYHCKCQYFTNQSTVYTLNLEMSISFHNPFPNFGNPKKYGLLKGFVV